MHALNCWAVSPVPGLFLMIGQRDYVSWILSLLVPLFFLRVLFRAPTKDWRLPCMRTGTVAKCGFLLFERSQSRHLVIHESGSATIPPFNGPHHQDNWSKKLSVQSCPLADSLKSLRRRRRTQLQGSKDFMGVALVNWRKPKLINSRKPMNHKHQPKK